MKPLNNAPLTIADVREYLAKQIAIYQHGIVIGALNPEYLRGRLDGLEDLAIRCEVPAPAKGLVQEPLPFSEEELPKLQAVRIERIR